MWFALVCVCSLQEFVKGCGSFTKRLVDDLLDKMTAGDHSKATVQIRQVLLLIRMYFCMYVFFSLIEHARILLCFISEKEHAH